MKVGWLAKEGKLHLWEVRYEEGREVESSCRRGRKFQTIG